MIRAVLAGFFVSFGLVMAIAFATHEAPKKKSGAGAEAEEKGPLLISVGKDAAAALPEDVKEPLTEEQKAQIEKVATAACSYLHTNGRVVGIGKVDVESKIRDGKIIELKITSSSQVGDKWIPDYVVTGPVKMVRRPISATESKEKLMFEATVRRPR